MKLISSIKNAGGNALIISMISLLLVACGNQEEKSENITEQIIRVKTEKLVSTKTEQDLVLSGNIEGNATVKLGFMVSGKISQITFVPGQTVPKGSLVASLESTNYRLNKQLADVELSEAQDQFERLKIMHAKSSISELDFTKGNFALQKAGTQQKLAVKNLQDTRLYAPISGVLLSKDAEAGEIISAGTPLFVLADIKKVKVSALVPEGELKGLRKGQSADVEIEALGRHFTGTIVEVGAVADATTRAFTLKIEINNQDLAIRPGMIAQTRISSGNFRKGINVIPECIINEPGNQSYVYVVDLKSHRAFKRKISLGKMSANSVEILSGLSASETIVISGQTALNDGAHIKIDQ
ncbi:RND family efflux transporter MFP subunit [Pedobacter psychrotolerans]|uniref:MexH family multidrug efflux RND transporter periplasmic adaptor subunit n=1 Tax=Pedobacter psychrotolerans TaxID=1843235 RepID=A0A4R2HLW3_9SPHI|nr:efflux RND transporter periplasmic adaptor subunit [Pedobacter psychrotolerans]TCO31179.1 RND family efflux transporter MFP subunit [Pedobacter psychrotolerans]GGE41675.1 MexH family multidrug efflux RND transporter periplasmic adaptor subunit [Pedobacter psychrotolerans]